MVVSWPKDCWPCGTYASPRPTRALGRSFVTSSPSNSTRPDEHLSSPTAARSSVVLPAPLCPITAATPSEGTSMLTPWITSVRP
jgi:hypothetical protein